MLAEVTWRETSKSYLLIFFYDRKYTLERMFTNQLLDSAKDELSFRTVVKDLKNKSPMLHIVLLNPNSWCCTGYCSEDSAQYFVKMNLHPVVKVLFSHGHGSAASDPRLVMFKCC